MFCRVAAQVDGAGDADMKDILTEIRVLEDDSFQHLCIAESIQARHIGISLVLFYLNCKLRNS